MLIEFICHTKYSRIMHRNPLQMHSTSTTSAIKTNQILIFILLHSGQPKLHRVLAGLSATGLKRRILSYFNQANMYRVFLMSLYLLLELIFCGDIELTCSAAEPILSGFWMVAIQSFCMPVN